jgi:hypothetical protein
MIKKKGRLLQGALFLFVVRHMPQGLGGNQNI